MARCELLCIHQPFHTLRMFPGGKRPGCLEEAGSTGGDKGCMEPSPAAQGAAGAACREAGMLTDQECVGRAGQYLGNTGVNV